MNMGEKEGTRESPAKIAKSLGEAKVQNMVPLFLFIQSIVIMLDRRYKDIGSEDLIHSLGFILR